MKIKVYFVIVNKYDRDNKEKKLKNNIMSYDKKIRHFKT